MYFWRIGRLKQELQAGVVGPRAAFSYLLATLLLYTVTGGIPGLWNDESIPSELMNWTGFLAGVVLVCVGTYASYISNGGARGIDFLARYLSLGWVLLIRVMVLAAVVSLCIFVLLDQLALPHATQWQAWSNLLIAIGLLVLYYWRLAVHMKQVASPVHYRVQRSG